MHADFVIGQARRDSWVTMISRVLVGNGGDRPSVFSTLSQ